MNRHFSCKVFGCTSMFLLSLIQREITSVTFVCFPGKISGNPASHGGTSSHLNNINFFYYSKNVEELGTFWKQGVPLEVIPLAYRPVQIQIENKFGGCAKLRMASRKMVNYLVWG